MTNTFFRDISDLPDPEGEDTRPLVLPLLEAHGAVITVEMVSPNDVYAGVVMRGSFAHRQLLAAGYYELRKQS